VRDVIHRVLAATLAAPAPLAATGCRGDRPDGGALAPVDASGGIAPAEDAQAELPPDSGGDASACAPELLDAGLFGEDASCGAFVRLPCGVPSPSLRGEGCFPSVDLCTAVCPQEFFFFCAYPPASCQDGGLLPDADVVIDCSLCLGNQGRRPVGFARAPRAHLAPGAPGRGPGALFAAAAVLERASVDAFVHLRARLAAFGAPARLLLRAEEAARDERRHARVIARLAERFGESAPPVGPPAPFVPLDFESFVTENAVEGGIRETFGALVALHQARTVADPVVARAMRGVAADEVRHAELAWEIDRWARRRLPRPARLRVRAAQVREVASLGAETCSRFGGSEGARAAGLPDATRRVEAARLLGSLLLAEDATDGALPERPRRVTGARTRRPKAFSARRPP